MTGIFDMAAARWLRRAIKGEWVLILAGALFVVFGVLLLLMPGTGALAVIWLIATYVLLFGILLMGLVFRLCSWRNTIVQRAVG